MKILIVEKERDLLYALERTLKNRGYDVSTAFDGVQGTESVLNNDFDLILFGEQIPRISAGDIISQAKQKGKNTTFMLMRKTQNEQFPVPVENGCYDGIIYLPFTPEKICRCIDDTLNKCISDKKTV